MAASPESRFKPIVDVVRLSKERPVLFATQALMLVSVAATPLILPSLGAGINSVLDSLGRAVANTQIGRDLNERKERNRQSIEAVVQGRQAALKADFEQTDGVDRTQTADKSWLLTMTRPSLTLGGTPPEILGRVTRRIVDETGCQSFVISEAYVDRSSWFSQKPTVYSVAATDCPK